MQFIDQVAAKNFLNQQSHDTNFANMGFVVYPGSDDTNRQDIRDALLELGVLPSNILIERDPTTYGHNVVKVKDSDDVELLHLQCVRAGMDAFPNVNRVTQISAAKPATITLSQHQAAYVSVLNSNPVNLNRAKAGVLVYSHDLNGQPLPQPELDVIYAALKALGVQNARKVNHNGVDSVELDDEPEIRFLDQAGVIGAKSVAFPNASMASTITFPLSGRQKAYVTYLNGFQHDAHSAQYGCVIYAGKTPQENADIIAALHSLGAKTARLVSNYSHYSGQVVILNNEAEIKTLADPQINIAAAVAAYPFYQAKAAGAGAPTATSPVRITREDMVRVQLLNGFEGDTACAAKGTLGYSRDQHGNPLSQQQRTEIHDALKVLGANSVQIVTANPFGTNNAYVEVPVNADIQMLANKGVDAAPKVNGVNKPASPPEVNIFPITQPARNDINMLNALMHDRRLASNKGIIVYQGNSSSARKDIRDALHRLGGTHARIDNAYSGFTNPVVVLDNKAQVQALAHPQIGLNAANETANFYQSPAAGSASTQPAPTPNPSTPPAPPKAMPIDVERAMRWMVADVPGKRLVSTVTSQDSTDPQLTGLVALFAHHNVNVKAEIVHIHDPAKLVSGQYVIIDDPDAIQHLSDEGSPEAAKIKPATVQSQQTASGAPATAVAAFTAPTTQPLGATADPVNIGRLNGYTWLSTQKPLRLILDYPCDEDEKSRLNAIQTYLHECGAPSAKVEWLKPDGGSQAYYLVVEDKDDLIALGKNGMIAAKDLMDLVNKGQAVG